MPGEVEDWIDTVSVEVALPPEVTLTPDGLRERVGPEGEETAERFTVPANPLRPVTVIVEVVEEPGVADMDAGFAEMLKSGFCEVVVKNSDMALAPASFDVRVARFQFTSIVFVRE